MLWQSGGGTQPMLGAARLLVERGHSVDVLAPSMLADRVEKIGAHWLPAPPEAEFDSARGRALEDQPEFTREVTCGRVFPCAVLEIAASRSPDALVVDHFLVSTLAAARSTGRPTAAVAHTAHRFHGAVRDETERRARLDDVCSALGLAPHRQSGESLVVEVLHGADLVLVPMTREFDPWPETPRHVIHSGPLFEEPDDALSWEDPWLSAGSEPIVLVSLSSQYMRQEETLRSILKALSSLPVRVIVTTGFELDLGDTDLPGSPLVRTYVPHRALMPHAALVIAHGGMGTVMAAFACGAPLVCVPLGRDQLGNAARVEELGAGLALPSDAESARIAETVARALASPALRRGAGRMRSSVASYGDGELARAALEELATRDPAKL